MDYSSLHKALVKRAVKSLKDAQSKSGKILWTKHEELTQKKCRGWMYSWYVYDGGGYSSNDPTYYVTPIHPSLEEEAKKYVEKEKEINNTILLISLYINKILTLNDQCLVYIHEDMPLFLHPIIKEFCIGFAEKPKLKTRLTEAEPHQIIKDFRIGFTENPENDLRLTEAERKGKEELYALNLLEMTGD